MPATRGAATDAVVSGMTDNTTVDSPWASIRLAASPTDRQQNGHTGTNKTTSTSSAFMPSIIAGTLVSRKVSGRSRKPMNE